MFLQGWDNTSQLDEFNYRRECHLEDFIFSYAQIKSTLLLLSPSTSAACNERIFPWSVWIWGQAFGKLYWTNKIAASYCLLLCTGHHETKWQHFQGIGEIFAVLINLLNFLKADFKASAGLQSQCRWLFATCVDSGHMQHTYCSIMSLVANHTQQWEECVPISVSLLFLCLSVWWQMKLKECSIDMINALSEEVMEQLLNIWPQEITVALCFFLLKLISFSVGIHLRSCINYMKNKE